MLGCRVTFLISWWTTFQVRVDWISEIKSLGSQPRRHCEVAHFEIASSGSCQDKTKIPIRLRKPSASGETCWCLVGQVFFRAVKLGSKTDLRSCRRNLASEFCGEVLRKLPKDDLKDVFNMS